MLYGLWNSAAGALTSSYQHDVIANNLANVDTVGFKSDLATFTSRKTEVKEGNGSAKFTNRLLEQYGGGIFAAPNHTDFAPAANIKTSNPYDVAIKGDGFFQVQKGDQTMFTRDGRFAARDGMLVTQESNLPVLDINGDPIVVDAKFPITISKSGLITQEGTNNGANLGIVDFADKQVLTKQGQNLYTTDGVDGTLKANVHVTQGALESSGVKPTEQFVSMIKNQRLLETNLKMLKLQDESLGKLIRQFSS